MNTEDDLNVWLGSTSSQVTVMTSYISVASLKCNTSQITVPDHVISHLVTGYLITTHLRQGLLEEG